MITFKTVRYMNLLSTGNVFTEISLDKYRNVLVIGANGSAKSTIIEALSFGLYGKPLRNVNRPQLINSINQKGLLVEVEFSIAGKDYLVRRGMKPNVFEIWVDGKMIDQDSQSRDYQEVLETQILRLNHKSFCQIIVLSIANYTPFMMLPAASRREVIEDLLDIQIFSAMNTILKDRVNENKNQLQTIEHNIELVELKIKNHQDHLEDLKQNHALLIQNREDQIVSYTADSAKKKVLLEAKEAVEKSLNEQYNREIVITEEVRKNEQLIRSVKERMKRLRKEIEFYEHTDTCPTCKQSIDESFKSKELATKFANEEMAKQGIAKLEKIIANAKESLTEGLYDNLVETRTQIEKLNRDIDYNSRLIATWKEEIAEFRRQMSKLVDESEKSQLEAELTLAIEKKKEYTKNREVLSLAGQLLKDGGIKSRIIRQYVPVINKLIAKYLAALDFFVQFEIDEQFKETIKSRHRDNFTYSLFSKGEQLRLDLALLFAFRDITKLRNSSSTNLLFFDEILDSSLDQDGAEDFLDLIGKIDDCNIFVISHRGDQIIDKFQHVIKLEKIRNFSRIAWQK